MLHNINAFRVADVTLTGGVVWDPLTVEGGAALFLQCRAAAAIKVSLRPDGVGYWTIKSGAVLPWPALGFGGMTLYVNGTANDVVEALTLGNFGRLGEAPGEVLLLAAAPKTGAEDTALTVSFSAPGSGGTVTGYQSRSKATLDANYGDVAAATSPFDVTSLTAETSYDVQVRAVGPGGLGEWATVTAETDAA